MLYSVSLLKIDVNGTFCIKLIGRCSNFLDHLVILYCSGEFFEILRMNFLIFYTRIFEFVLRPLIFEFFTYEFFVPRPF